jgi:hypothetical protein
MSFKIQLLETSTQKQKEQRRKQLGPDKLVTTQIWKLKSFVSFFYPFLHIFNIMQYLNHQSSNKHMYLLEKDLNNLSERELPI